MQFLKRETLEWIESQKLSQKDKHTLGFSYILEHCLQNEKNLTVLPADTFTDETHGCMPKTSGLSAPHFSELISIKPSDSRQQRMSPYFPIVFSLPYSCSHYNRSKKIIQISGVFQISVTS